MTAQQEQRERFQRIAESAFDPLQRYLRRRVALHDAEDVLSDVMLTVWRRIDDAPPVDVLPWCYGIARRVLANHRRSDRRRLRLVARLGAEPVTDHPDPADLRPDPDLADALAALSPVDREILTLWAWEQLEPRDLAVALDLTPNAAALRLSRARKKLAQVLTRQDHGGAGHIGGRDPEELTDD